MIHERIFISLYIIEYTAQKINPISELVGQFSDFGVFFCYENSLKLSFIFGRLIEIEFCTMPKIVMLICSFIYNDPFQL